MSFPFCHESNIICTLITKVFHAIHFIKTFLSFLDHTTSLKILPQKSLYKINEELECSADGNPAPTLTWSVSEQEATIRHGQGWKIVTIPKSWSDTEQTLTCSGYNTVDGVQSEDFSKDITIQVSSEFSVFVPNPLLWDSFIGDGRLLCY